MLNGCATGDDDTRIVRRQRTLLEGLPDATRGGERIQDNGPAGLRSNTDIPLDQLIRKDGDKETLLAKRPRHVMLQLALRLDDGKEKLFFDQLVSDVTKQHYISQGQDPHEVIAFLQQNYDDIMRLFARMPAGELSPSILFERMSPTEHRLMLTGTAAKGMKFTELWLEQKGGNWKFVWVK